MCQNLCRGEALTASVQSVNTVENMSLTTQWQSLTELYRTHVCKVATVFGGIGRCYWISMVSACPLWSHRGDECLFFLCDNFTPSSTRLLFPLASLSFASPGTRLGPVLHTMAIFFFSEFSQVCLLSESQAWFYHEKKLLKDFLVIESQLSQRQRLVSAPLPISHRCSAAQIAGTQQILMDFMSFYIPLLQNEIYHFLILHKPQSYLYRIRKGYYFKHRKGAVLVHFSLPYEIPELGIVQEGLMVLRILVAGNCKYHGIFEEL